MPDLIDRTVTPIHQVVNTRALLDVIAERKRQIDYNGRTPAHDDTHTTSELIRAACCYALASLTHFAVPGIQKMLWPWSTASWKPRDPRENLVRASALLLAEIERLDRAALREDSLQNAQAL